MQSHDKWWTRNGWDRGKVGRREGGGKEGGREGGREERKEGERESGEEGGREEGKGRGERLRELSYHSGVRRLCEVDPFLCQLL